MISARYHKEMSIALPGQVSDTSRYNIDGACVYAPANNQPQVIACGIAVTVNQVDDFGVKEMRPLTDNAVPYGVTVRSHYALVGQGAELGYAAGDGMNIMTVGRIWLQAETAFTPAFGTPVHLHKTTGKAQENQADAINPPGWTYTGAKTSFDGVHMVEIQVHQL